MEGCCVVIEKMAPNEQAKMLMRRQGTQNVDVFSAMPVRSPTRTRSMTSVTRSASKTQMKNKVNLGAVKPPVDYFMSKLKRNLITGAITMEDAEGEFDFQYIDLYDRLNISAGGLSLLDDEFIYKAEPLVNRSWLYQSMFELEHSTERREELFTQGQIPIKTQNRIRLEALEAPVYETPGEYSPVVAVSAALISAGMSGDEGLLASVMGVFIICLGIALRGNDADRADRQRLMSVLVRIGWIVWRLVVTSFGNGISGVFQTLTLAVIGGDLIVNDVMKLIRLNLLATRYEIIKALPGKMFVVAEKKFANEFKGCDFSEKIVGSDVLELMSREGQEDKKIDVIVDVHGLLCKLVPLTRNDLYDLFDIQDETEPTRIVYCTQTFNADRPTANDVTERRKHIETFKKNRTSTVMKRGYVSTKRPSIDE
jgi:hypothetical protein